ncbi:MAG: hypothetical protein AB4050_05705 [Synechococcus sp.]
MDLPLNPENMLVQMWNRREEPRTFQGAGLVLNLRVQSENGLIQMSGLATDGSLTGVGVVVVADAPLYEGDACTVSMGRGEPIAAKIVWIEELDRSILRLGLEYLV